MTDKAGDILNYADAWAGFLQSNREIKVNALAPPYPCWADSCKEEVCSGSRCRCSVACAMHGKSDKLTSMRARAVTNEPLSACRHSVQTLLPASCAFLELATSCAASLALSRFSDVALAACKNPNYHPFCKFLICKAFSSAPESSLDAAETAMLTFNCSNFAFLRACSLSFCKVCASSCSPGHFLGCSLLLLSLPYDWGCAISCAL